MNIRASDDISFFIDGYDNIYVDTLASNTGMCKKKHDSWIHFVCPIKFPHVYFFILIILTMYYFCPKAYFLTI